MAWTTPATWISGAVLTAAQLNEQVRDNLSALSTAFLIPAFQSGQYYVPQMVQDATATAVLANRLYALPITIPNAITADRIVMRCTAGAAGNVRMGIYQDNGGVPGSLVVDGGAVAITAAVKTVTISQALAAPAKYWLAAVFDNIPTMQSVEGVGLLPVEGTAVFQANRVGLYKTFTYGALPNPFGNTLNYTTPFPSIGIRVA